MRELWMESGDGTNKKNPPLRIELADSFFRRFLGLMGRRELLPGPGLLIAPCRSIHMCFMRFAIDAVYIDQKGKVLKVVLGLRPWIGVSCCPRAWGILELPSGTAAAWDIHPGMVLKRTGS